MPVFSKVIKISKCRRINKEVNNSLKSNFIWINYILNSFSKVGVKGIIESRSNLNS